MTDDTASSLLSSTWLSNDNLSPRYCLLFYGCMSPRRWMSLSPVWRRGRLCSVVTSDTLLTAMYILYLFVSRRMISCRSSTAKCSLFANPALSLSADPISILFSSALFYPCPPILPCPHLPTLLCPCPPTLLRYKGCGDSVTAVA